VVLDRIPFALNPRLPVLALTQRREIDAVLVTESSRCGRSTMDRLGTLTELEARRVSNH
jgi:putative DNA-invertase from lambdoid prophage Rac